jgi:class 3 adenylate cyclase/tetratricopeptide (TPR) repeat protein
MQCPRCPQENPPGARFCNACGAPVSYTPRHLAEKILTSRSALEGERKLVTVLFCDMANSTTLAERLGADAMHALVNRFFEVALAEVHRYEGTINQFLGDGFMALFGAPLTFEDHARRAVLAALDIQRAVRSLRAEGNLAGASGLTVRMGLNTGPVVVGKIGDNLRMDYTAVGDTTNLAARLEHLARPGDIYLSEQTYELVRSVAECRLLGARSIKGKAEPVVVYEVVAARTVPQPAPGKARGIGTTMVGRAADTATLVAAVERLERGEGSVVSVIGEAGLGKSRLLTEVRRRVGGVNVRWLEGRGLSFGQTLSYWPFLEILRQAGDITEQHDPAESWARLQALITGLFPDTAGEIAPYLASLLGVPLPADLAARVQHLDAQAMGRQVLLASRRFFERLATRQPLVLVFEDLHWFDQSSMELIEHLLPLVEKVPLLLCSASRPEAGTPAARLREVARQKHATRYTEIVLAPLSAGDSEALLAGLLGTPDVPPHLHQLVLTKAEGNPLFVEEVVRSLAALGVLAKDETRDAWRIRRAVADVRIPDTIQGVIMARIDRLDDDVKQLLKLAAVVGRSFLYRVLGVLADADRELDRHLAELQDRELIRERRRLPELEYIFNHALVQEATYASILIERRRQIHRSVAECVEELLASRLEEFYGVLAHHYAEAEVWEKAQAYLVKAGDQAGRVAADAEALKHYRRAVEAYGRAFGDRWDPVQRAALERKIGEALFRRGEHQQALEYLIRALGYLGVTYPASRSTVRLGILRQALTQCGHRLGPTRLLRRRTTGTDLAAEEQLHIYTTMAWIDYFGDQERLVYDCLALLNVSETGQVAVGVAGGSSAVGLILDLVGLFGLARRYHDRAVALSSTLEDATVIGSAHHFMGHHQFLLGDWDSALLSLRRSSASYRSGGLLREWAAAEALIAQLLNSRGEFALTLERSRELLRVGEDAADSQMTLWGLNVQGTAERGLGRLEAAEATSRSALELSRSVPDYASLAVAAANLGLCHLRRGDPMSAFSVLEETSRLGDERRSRGFEITFARNALAVAHLDAAERTSGDERSRALASAQRACRAALRKGRAFRGALPGALRNQGTWAWLNGRPERARRWWEQSVAVAVELGSRYEVALTWAEMGRRLGDRESLERATGVFAEIGAELDLAAARGWLQRLPAPPARKAGRAPKG